MAWIAHAPNNRIHNMLTCMLNMLDLKTPKPSFNLFAFKTFAQHAVFS